MKRLFLTLFVPCVLVGMAQAQYATLSVSQGSIITVPTDYLGISCEWTGCDPVGGLGAFGTANTGVDAVLAQMMLNLNMWGKSTPIRLGGNSTDQSTIAYPTEPLLEFYQTTGTKFTVGINMASATAAQAATMASTYNAALPAAITAFELGNEPDSYGIGTSAYYANVAAWESAIEGSTSSLVSFEGPSCSTSACVNASFFGNIPGVLATNKSISIGSVHYYVGSSTSCASQPDCLLYPSAYILPMVVSSSVHTAHALGKKFRINETNSLYSGGEAGISNAFGSALWALAYAFQDVSAGIDGINFHTGMTAGTTGYNPFVITVTAGSPNTFSLTITNPEYYAMYAFDVATQNNRYVYPVTATLGTPCSISGWTPTATTSSTNGCFGAWDTLDTSGTERLALINLDEAHSGSVTYTPATSYTTASVCYLSNSASPAYSGLAATTTFAGQTWSGSTNGTLQGTPSYTTLTPSGGTFTIPIAVTQAAIVRFGAGNGC